MKYLLCLPLACAIAVAQTGTPAVVPSPAPAVKPEDKCEVKGTVVNSMTGEPLKKAHLSLRPIGQQDGMPYGTTTDAGGHFLLDDVDPGRYSLLASRNGFVTQQYSRDGAARRATTLTLAAGQKMTDVIFKLTPQAIIAGHIVDEDGEPLAGVTVQTMRVGYARDGKKQLMPGAGAATNDLGEYRIRGLAPGKYFLAAIYRSAGMNSYDLPERITGGSEAQQAADEGYPTTYYPNATRAESAAQIEIGPGSQIQGIDMRLIRTRTAHIRGRVVNVPSRFAQNMMVQLLPRDMTFARMGIQNIARAAGNGGTFELRGVAPGSYVLSAFSNNDVEALRARMPIEVGASNIDKIELTLMPGVEIAGRLVVEGQPNPAAGVTGPNANSTNPRPYVSLMPKASSMMGGPGTQVKEDLAFKLDHVSREPYDIGVGGLPEGYYLKSVRIGDQDVTDTGVDFTEAAPAGEIVVIVSANGGQIDGTVQNEKSEPAAGATVVLIPEASRRSSNYLYKRVGTDQNGHFTIKGVKPGEYKVFAWEDVENGAYQDPDFLKPLESKGEAVSIKESAHESVQVKVIPVEK